MDTNATTPPRSRERRWFQFSLRTLLAVVTAVAAWLGWQNYLERARLAKEADARETVFRAYFAEHPVSNVFIGYGWDKKTAAYLDPPRGFLDRMSDLKISFQPASEASLPDPGEFDIEKRLVHDPKTGKASSILSVGVIQSIDDHTMELDLEENGGVLNGRGYHTTVELKDGKWEVTGRSDEWVS
jgi:hypothetical protein